MLIEEYANLFVHRSDRWARQRSDGAYLSIRQPVTPAVIAAHLDGRLTAGWYQLAHDNTIKWACLDADAEDGLAQVQQVAAYLSGLGVEMPIEASRRGAHGWLFFDQPLKAAGVKKVLERLIAHLGLAVEVFPKQSQLADGGVGSLVRGPLGVHQKSRQVYFFIGAPRFVGAQLRYLAGVRKTTAEDLRALWRSLPKETSARPGTVIRSAPASPNTVTHSSNTIARINRAILGEHGALSAFIGQYVNLDPQGRGLCPWHDDQVASFRVNDRTARWICFACPPLSGSRSDWRTGDAFEFAAQYLYGGNKSIAVRELARRYGL